MLGFKTEIKTESALWKNIMNSWLSINREYIEDWYDANGNYHDCAYWYNERASVSILAGAIWRKGGVCLEEYSSIKGEIDKTSEDVKDVEKYGRTDLYFYIGDDEYIVEAKFLMSQSITEDKIQKSLNDAISDCKKSLHHERKENEKLKGMAIVFVVPFKKNKQIDFDLIKRDVNLFCSFEKTSEGDILQTRNDNIANSCYVIGKEVEN